LPQRVHLSLAAEARCREKDITRSSAVMLQHRAKLSFSMPGAIDQSINRGLKAEIYLNKYAAELLLWEQRWNNQTNSFPSQVPTLRLILCIIYYLLLQLFIAIIIVIII
jgi:hypothetical protein